MRDTQFLLARWRATLAQLGRPTELVWLPHEAMSLREQLYYRPVEPPLTDANVETAMRLLPDEEPGVLMLVGCTNRSFVTLLMDPFGSDSEEFIESQNFYFFATPYADRIARVDSPLQWVWLKHVASRLRPRLSSLDYAFGARQARVA